MTNRHVNAVFAALLAVGGLAAGGVAATGIAFAATEASGQDKQDTAALAGMKITLQQAIAAAEQQSGGRAVSADVTLDNGAARVSVEIAGPQGAKTLLVDGQTAQVTAAPPGEDSHDGENGQDGEDHEG